MIQLVAQAGYSSSYSNVREGFYGQDTNAISYNLCRINMLLHNLKHDMFDIAHGDTLTEPKHSVLFDAIVSNRPYSIKWEGKDNPDLCVDPRFNPAGAIASKSKADLAFVLHVISRLTPTGTGAIVVFPGYSTAGEPSRRFAST